jgi:hypothetical protein
MPLLSASAAESGRVKTRLVLQRPYVSFRRVQSSPRWRPSLKSADAYANAARCLAHPRYGRRLDLAHQAHFAGRGMGVLVLAEIFLC